LSVQPGMQRMAPGDGPAHAGSFGRWLYRLASSSATPEPLGHEQPRAGPRAPRWADVDLAGRRVHVRQAQVDDELDSTKSEDSDRIVTIDPGTADVLRAWRKAQLAERIAWAAVWTDTGRVFTREDGTALRPGAVSEHFATVVARLGLPPVRFHDLRHGAATMLLAAGQPPKVISETLGHSTVAFTMDVYTEVATELAEAAALAIAAFIPRKARAESVE
jgi:integrase